MNTPEINDGGPAFPVPIQKLNWDTRPEDFDACNCGGMSLRDWFAGQALASAILLEDKVWRKQESIGKTLPVPFAELCANSAVEIADAMIERLSKK